MLHTIYRPYAFGEANGYGFGHNRGCGCGCTPCRCKEHNFYSFPVPKKRELKQLDTTLLTIHTDEFVRRGCEFIDCKHVPVVRKEERKSFIITANVECGCLRPGFHYQLDIDRDVPYEVNGLNTFIRVVPCGLFPDKVELNFTKTIHGGMCGEFDGTPVDGDIDVVDSENCGCNLGGIPDSPAFPAEDLIGNERRRKDEVIIPVKLDLLGNYATGEHFYTNRFKVPGTGRPYQNKFILFLNNSGEFVLSRNYRRRSDYA
jgi:hypothetical protein